MKISAETKDKSQQIENLNYLKTHENYKSIENTVSKTKNELVKQGYIDAIVEIISKTNDSVFSAQLNLGAKIETIVIAVPEIYKDVFYKTSSQNQGDSISLRFTETEAQLKKWNGLIAEKGDPFSTLQLANINRINDTTLAAELQIKTNQKRTLDKIVVKGYEKFSGTYLKRFLKLEPGETFNLNDIKKRSARLDNLRFASQQKEPEVLFTNDSTILYIYPQKKASNNFDGFLGFGTNENTNKIEFDGYLNLNLINNLNYGESLNLIYKSDEIDQQTISVRADLPYLFKTPLGLELELNLFRKDTTFSNARQSVKLKYQIDGNQYLGAGIQAISSSNLLDANTAILQDYDSNFYTVNYNYQTPNANDLLFPLNFWLDISAGFGNRETASSDQKQNQFALTTFKIFNLNDKNSIYTKLSGASLVSDSYFDNELYRFGGINSVRGFEENSLVANLFGVLNTEYRYRLSNTIYINSILDAAYSENDLTDDKTKFFGFGFGFGLLTNSGLFKLNYASGKTEDRPFRLSDSKVHISLTATF
ncbi:hypothetical protein Q2T40_06595 [Winogradskyella maritima]|uniref:Outer membrane protein assembly factor BamA n=1 Tax=Winogradskyella maritima TaxID=1517766 RepID=A0ABV8AP99_9FLAO|nr:hypothetical protein [Winogradskyella maritima]